MSLAWNLQKYNKEVLDYLQKAGFGGNVFWNSPRPIYQGPDCEWPSEKEVFTRRFVCFSCFPRFIHVATSRGSTTNVLNTLCALHPTVL